jgi:hypothetical protein
MQKKVMVIPKLFRNKNKDYLIYAVNIDHNVIWCNPVHDKPEPEKRTSKTEFENMLYNQGWERRDHVASDYSVTTGYATEYWL